MSQCLEYNRIFQVPISQEHSAYDAFIMSSYLTSRSDGMFTRQASGYAITISPAKLQYFFELSKIACSISINFVNFWFNFLQFLFFMNIPCF